MMYPLDSQNEDTEDSDSVISSEDDVGDVDPLETFLAALNLTEYWPLFQKERMDLEGRLYLVDFSCMIPYIVAIAMTAKSGHNIIARY